MRDVKELESIRPMCLSLFAPTVIDVPAPLIEEYTELLEPAFAGMGFFITRIDRDKIRTSQQLFDSLVASCGFPATFGYDWDALRDSLLDFSWMKPKPSGFLLLYRHPEYLNWTDLSEFIIIADRVRMIYAQHRKPFKVLAAHNQSG